MDWAKLSATALLNKHRQLLLYGLIGLSGATIDFVLFILFYYEFGIPPFAASFLSVSFGILNNFFLNTYFNFKKYDHLFARMINFYLIGLGGALLSSVLIWFFFDIIGLDANVSKILTIPPVVLAQFFINKRVSFSDRPLKIYSVRSYRKKEDI